jgi:uncharacterized protein YggE
VKIGNNNLGGKYMLKKMFFLSLMFCVCTVILYAADNDENQKKLITVSGSGYVDVLPDTAYYSFSFCIEKDSLEGVMKIGEAVKKNVKAVLDSLTIKKEDIVLDNVGSFDRYNYDTSKNIYKYKYQLKIKITDFTLIAKLRKSLLNEKTFAPAESSWFSRKGLSVDNNVEYEISQNKNLYENEALKKSYENAMEKIKTISGLGNLKYSIYRIQESGSYSQELSYAPAPSGNLKMMRAVEDSSASAEDEMTIPTLQRIYSNITIQAEIIGS